MKKTIFVLMILCAASFGFAAIYNITEITELSESDKFDAYPHILDDELTIYFTKCPADPYFDPALGDFVRATRTSTSDPFSNLTSTPFVNITSSDYMFSPWVSEDRLRMYFDGSDESVMDYDVYETSRTLTTDPFNVPGMMIPPSQASTQENRPRLANNELSLYFLSDQHDPGGTSRIYRATRPNLDAEFGTPAILSEISNAYYLFDVTNDELTLILGDNATGQELYYSQRSSTSDPFPTPEILEDLSPKYLASGSVTEDLSRIYFSLGNSTTSYFGSFEIYCGDLVLGPPATPTPTPTPDLPDPLPSIAMAANPDQIASHTGDHPSPWGGVFDSAGRYIFFDQKVSVSYTETEGTNQLIRMTGWGDTATFETLATQSQLAAVDSRWGEESSPLLVNLDLLSDGSIVMSGGGDNPQKLLRIVPGNPPQITTIASFSSMDVWGAPQGASAIAVDRNQNPNKIYLLIQTDIYTVYANQTNATPSVWLEPEDDLDGVYDMVIDNNGDILFGAFYGMLYSPYKIVRYKNRSSFDTINKIDKDTKAISSISKESFGNSLKGNYRYTLALDINRITGDLFGLYYCSSPYPYTGSRFNLFKATKDGNGLYTALDFATEHQVLEDPDIEPYWEPSALNNFLISGLGLAVHPSGNSFFCSSGSNDEGWGYIVRQGIDSIVRIGTEARLSSKPAAWCHYE